MFRIALLILSRDTLNELRTKEKKRKYSLLKRVYLKNSFFFNVWSSYSCYRLIRYLNCVEIFSPTFPLCSPYGAVILPPYTPTHKQTNKKNGEKLFHMHVVASNLYGNFIFYNLSRCKQTIANTMRAYEWLFTVYTAL